MQSRVYSSRGRPKQMHAPRRAELPGKARYQSRIVGIMAGVTTPPEYCSEHVVHEKEPASPKGHLEYDAITPDNSSISYTGVESKQTLINSLPRISYHNLHCLVYIMNPSSGHTEKLLCAQP
jgi:hypothetical protein